MKFIKYLIVFVLTLVLVVLLAISSSITSPIPFLAIVTLIYCSLIYLVWPVGTSYSAVAFNRFYIVMGIFTLIIAGDVLLNNQCPTFPFSTVSPNYQSSGIAAVILFSCGYLGKAPTILLLCGLSGRLLYIGYTRKPNPTMRQDLSKDP